MRRKREGKWQVRHSNRYVSHVREYPLSKCCSLQIPSNHLAKKKDEISHILNGSLYEI